MLMSSPNDSSPSEGSGVPKTIGPWRSMGYPSDRQRLEVYRRGGDSLMGRYFSYRMHPFSVAESLTKQLPDPERIIRAPKKPRAAD